MMLERVKGVVITNAAGGLNESFSVGDFMIIQDHLYIPGLAGFSPLVGPNDDRIGPRFPPMGDAYNKEWRNLAKSVAADIGENIKSGLQIQYESRDMRLIRILKDVDTPKHEFRDILLCIRTKL